MGYKTWGKEISFADLAVSKSLEHNRSLKMMMSIEKVVKWRDVENFAQPTQECHLGFGYLNRKVLETVWEPRSQETI